jgi:predicted nuclease of predicted toxin-antitoxin system
MRLCANENVPGTCVTALRQQGHDVLWIREVQPGISDDAVLKRAQAESRLLLTFDKDFGDLVFHRGASASRGVVLFRLRKPSPDSVARRVTQILESRDDWEGQFSLVDEHSFGCARYRRAAPAYPVTTFSALASHNIVFFCR